MRKDLDFMKVVVNREVPFEIKERLSSHAEIMPFWAPHLGEKALRGHADLFLTQVGKNLIAAHNAPLEVRQIFQLEGETDVVCDLASLGAYNVAVGKGLAIGNAGHVDKIVMDALRGHEFISVRQSMARCNALILDDDAVITSDGGIAKALAKNGRQFLQVSPYEIALPGYRNGCFGGCCGNKDGIVFLTGSLRFHPDGEKIARFVRLHRMDFVELSDAPLLDVGSLFFV